MIFHAAPFFIWKIADVLKQSRSDVSRFRFFFFLRHLCNAEQ